MSYLRSYFQTREEESKAVRRSREIYEEIFKQYRIVSQPEVSGLCSERDCSGWQAYWYNGRGIHWVVCGHRKRQGLEARRKDMIPQHIQ
ncbi:hypothetical protein Agabi119p4_8421 [Agaricus bisporus var. burnettii]|uniref:Uncharacterized protein n=1 Tax=Agaricus bisporus var. burnettii TaxID=192524 RepID=A0A8H7C720_AGABI|nr:hypothetical protein Agabi119p4_8421 [Agaricus bisporus var. burnettii]